MKLLNILSLFLTASFPIVFIFLYLYKKDKNKEPHRLLIQLFIGGMMSVLLAFFLSVVAFVLIPFYGMKEIELTKTEVIIEVFIGIALVEEYCKWIFAKKIGYKSKELDESYDMLLYAGTVSLGFAFAENLMYVFDYGLTTGFIRSVTSIPAHACDGIFMGYYLYLAKESEIKGYIIDAYKYKIFSLLIPTILHGIYDLCLMDKFSELRIVFPFFVIILIVFTIRIINKIVKQNRLKQI